MKVIIADFEIAKYGGIIEHVESKVKALKSLGHSVDIVQLSSSSTTDKRYKKAYDEIASGEYEKGKKLNSQKGGYEYSEATGYYKNNYYGYLLPPRNRIGVFESDAMEHWHDITKDVDLIMWNFMPTKSSAWGTGDFSFWWKFYDLPSDRIKQVFTVHDAYFDIRASNVTDLKEKILFLECAHIAAYQCCENIGIPRTLLLNPRYLSEKGSMPIVKLEKRTTDFFAAHMFKSMKHIDDLIRCVPYLNNGSKKYSVVIAGSGIEQAYMVAGAKIKPVYVCDCKRDPDLPKDLDKQISIWDYAEYYGMEYVGQISSIKVNEKLLSSKFAVDPSWCKHYSQYSRTHINGFIIEAMLNGCYPVLRDYKGLVNDVELYDPLFENIKAVIIPWDATPKRFAKALKKAVKEITPEQYLSDTQDNYNLVYSLFNAKTNMKELLRLVKGGKNLVSRELVIGEDSDNVTRITKDIMEDFYNIKLPIVWKTK